ncbi:signal peptidase II [Holdemanella biformis]|uniref:signal peptidase II n=1 Tax=Holdemanella biformis TaxID=1735 RepID=UPI002490A65A|nr:signal peptidase II [Holdemanella biformis]
MKQGKTVVASLLIVFVTLGLDQWTKWAIVKSIKLNETVEMINHFFYLTYVQNTGAGFSMFAQAGMGFFATLTLIALVAMVYMFFKTNDSRYQICLSLVFSGAIGNFIDRMSLGYVRDFFSFYIFGYPFPVFNVADICITVGIALILISMFIDDKKEQAKWKQES